MKKLINLLSFSLVLGMMLCLSSAVSAYGVAPRLVDNADIISEENETAILDYLDRNSEEYDFDFAVLTEETINGEYIESYADDYYDMNGFGEDGILLVIVMDTREWAFSTAGLGISIFGDSELGQIEDAMVSELSMGNYENGIANFAQYAVSFVDYAKTYGYGFSENGYYTDDYGYNYPSTTREPASVEKRVGISALIGVIVSLIVVSVMRSKMNTVHKKSSAADYIKKDSLMLTDQRDVFVNRTVARTRRAESQSTHHGGGSSHISSSGVSHGGSHGHF